MSGWIGSTRLQEPSVGRCPNIASALLWQVPYTPHRTPTYAASPHATPADLHTHTPTTTPTAAPPHPASRSQPIPHPPKMKTAERELRQYSSMLWGDNVTVMLLLLILRAHCGIRTHPACSLRDPNSSCVLTVAVALAEGSDPSWLRDRIPRSAVGATLIILYRVSDVDESAPPAAYSLPGARFGGGSTSALPPQAAAVARREPSRWQLHLISPLTE